MATKKINKNYLFLIMLFLSNQAMALDFREIWNDLVGSRIGGRAAVEEEGYDLSRFEKPDTCGKFTPWGSPRIKDKTINEHSLFFCNLNYGAQFDTKLKVPLWSSEVLEKRNFEIRQFPNNWDYSENPDIPKKIQEHKSDFDGGLAQGTLASPYNQVINNEALEEEQLAQINKKAIKESLYYTNIVPMMKNGLRDGIWNDLELQVRKWGWEKSLLYVTTGVVYLNGKDLGETKESKARIPTHFYKIVTQPYNYGSVAYIIPNKNIYTGKNNSSKDMLLCNGGACSIEDFVVNIKEVERITGIEFYPKLAPYYAVQVKMDINEMFKEKRKKIEKLNEKRAE